MKTQFSEILSEIISQSEFSKNEMIRNCDIDRSSFFKFLNGTRTPTREQLNTICRKLLLTPDEERDLREAYSYATRGNKQITISNRVLDILWALENGNGERAKKNAASSEGISAPKYEVISGSREVFEYLRSAMIYEASEGGAEHEIDAFLPDLAEPFWTWLMAYIQENSGSGIKVCSLVELPARIYNTDALLYKFRYPLLYSLLYPDTFIGYYYYDNSAGASDLGELYPYSLILDSRTILLNAKMDRAVVTADRNFCGDDRKRFLNNLNSAHLLARKVANKEISKELTGGIEFCYGGCSLDYQLWDRNTRKYFSAKDLEGFLNSMPGTADEREAKALVNRRKAFSRNVLECVGSKTFLVDERFLPAARNWAVALTSKEELMIYSEDNRFHLMIDEMHIVRAFSSFFEGLESGGYVIGPGLAKEIVNRLIVGNSISAE